MQPPRDDFERGATDHFEFAALNVGEMSKIRIGHDGSGIGAGWHLARVVVENHTTGEVLTFECNRCGVPGSMARCAWPTHERAVQMSFARTRHTHSCIFK